MKVLQRVLLALIVAAVPVGLSAQDSAFGGNSRAHLFVYLAFAAAWIGIAAWVYRIGSKVRVLSLDGQIDS